MAVTWTPGDGEYTDIRYELSGDGIAKITIDRPEVRNAFRPQTLVEVSEARSDWAPDPKKPLPKFNPPRRVPHGVTLIGRLFDEGTLAQAGMALEAAFGVAAAHPSGF